MLYEIIDIFNDIKYISKVEISRIIINKLSFKFFKKSKLILILSLDIIVGPNEIRTITDITIYRPALTPNKVVSNKYNEEMIMKTKIEVTKFIIVMFPNSVIKNDSIKYIKAE